MTGDRNFDDLAHKFVKNIYGSGKGDIRQRVVWEDIEQILKTVTSEHPLHILDAGGGLGQLSRQMARLGHRVTLCDISSEMLALAQKEIDADGLTDQYRLIHCPAQSVGQHIDEPVDIVLFHAVMEWLADPKPVLQSLLDIVRVGGAASVMFYNQHGLVFKNLICGNLEHVMNGMPHKKRFKLQPQKGLLPEDVYLWIEESGFDVKGKTGVRTFHDYMQKTRTGEYTFEQVLELESQLCRQEPYLSLGRYIHTWAVKQ
ncbi:tRNA uridine 5-oxyacetic acid(34) methyltransferase CmoM [Parasalinivibrio latis]|uniref:tRNA uridine 5-oxyacetic acid(34) methyltransferase CmoM n=1 Tax=Parasalinivibrio latis TaxID=2952610 RepID=UPI0030DEF5B6